MTGRNIFLVKKVKKAPPAVSNQSIKESAQQAVLKKVSESVNMSEFGAIFSENLGNYVQKRISRIRFKLDPDFYVNLLQDFGEDEKDQQDQIKQAPAKNGKKPSFGQKTSIKEEGAQKMQDIWAIPALQVRRQFLEQEAAKKYNLDRFK